MDLSHGAVLVLGSINVDHLVRVERLPVKGETVLATDYSVRAGGKGRNQAVAIAQLGGRVALLAATGDDTAGVAMRRGLIDHGVDTTHVVTARDGSATGLALITVDASGENSIVVNPGANSAVPSVGTDVLRGGGYAVLLCSLEVPLRVVADATAKARACGVATVVNAAPISGITDGGLEAIIDSTDILIVNQAEAGEIVSAPADDIDALALRLSGWRSAGAPVVIVTIGARGAIVLGDDGMRSVPAPAVSSTNTVGAGDAFAGMVALAVAAGHSLADAVALACATGAIVVSEPDRLSAHAVAKLSGIWK